MALQSETSPALPVGAVARYLQELADSDGQLMTPLKLMKMVYLCHGWSLGLLDRDLIREEVEAWQYGPVIPDLYHITKGFRSSPVPVNSLPAAGLAEDQMRLIKSVYNTYKKFSGTQLSALTHKVGTPWHKTWSDGKGRNKTIPTSEIRDHFKELAER